MTPLTPDAVRQIRIVVRKAIRSYAGWYADEAALARQVVKALDEAGYLRLTDGPLLCENCGKTMAAHGPLANCYPLDAAGDVC